MGKKYDAYAKAAEAEKQSLKRYQENPTDQNMRDLQTTRDIGDVTWGELLDDPQG